MKNGILCNNCDRSGNISYLIFRVIYHGVVTQSHLTSRVPRQLDLTEHLLSKQNYPLRIAWLKFLLFLGKNRLSYPESHSAKTFIGEQ